MYWTEAPLPISLSSNASIFSLSVWHRILFFSGSPTANSCTLIWHCLIVKPDMNQDLCFMGKIMQNELDVELVDPLQP